MVPRMGRGFGLLLIAAVLTAGCAYRTVTVESDPPGALVALYPKPKLTTVTPGSLRDLRAGRDYTVRVMLKGYDITYAAIPAHPGFPWPWPINKIIQWSGGYDSTISVTMRKCTDPSGCLEDEGTRQMERLRR